VTDTPYTGILVGWGWSLNDNVMRENLIRHNKVHNVMNLLEDGGGIYTLSKQPGTLIAENHVYNIIRSPWTSSYPIAAIYLDQGSDLITVQNNALENVVAGVHLNKGSKPPAGQHNVISNHDSRSQSIIDAAGLEPRYRDIKPLPPSSEQPLLKGLLSLKLFFIAVFTLLFGFVVYARPMFHGRR
jgi:hypothetical protein